jgi:hypothetical protein
MHVPSPEEIENARTEKGGWSRETLAQWGISWPPPKGWKRQLRDLYNKGKSE